MSKSEVIKNASQGVSSEDMEKINRYTRRKFTSDEVYVFSLVLCDNDVDRDYERFTVEALFEMEKLFVGKTGIFDHNPTAYNQAARIFECRVESRQDKKTVTGDEYFCLAARAYIPRTPENESLINRIEGGICKEVSVGLSAESRVCSVCSKNAGSCTHIRGEMYDGKLCYTELGNIRDAYEWSFVAVPAQREAGVIKHFKNNTETDRINMNTVIKNMEKGEGMTLTASECKSLCAYIKRLEKKAELGEEFREELEGEVLRLSAVAQPEIGAKTMANALRGLSVKELREFASVFKKKAEGMKNPVPVLAQKNTPVQKDNNKEFRI